MQRPVVRQDHEGVVGRSERVDAELDGLIQLKLIQQISIRIEDELLSENVRVFVVLKIAIERETMMRWMHSAILRSAGGLRSSEEHAGVS